MPPPELLNAELLEKDNNKLLNVSVIILIPSVLGSGVQKSPHLEVQKIRRYFGRQRNQLCGS